MTPLAKALLERLGWTNLQVKKRRVENCFEDWLFGTRPGGWDLKKHGVPPNYQDQCPNLDDLTVLYAESDKWARERMLGWEEHQYSDCYWSNLMRWRSEFETDEPDKLWQSEKATTRVEARQKAWLAAMEARDD